VVVELHRRFGLIGDPARSGPVPLGRLFDEFNLLHVSLPRLTRASIVQYLRGQGIIPGSLEEEGTTDEHFAGFLFTTGADGYVFVAEEEQQTTEQGEPRLYRTTVGRRRFTAAHELGHFLMHRDRMTARRWIADTPQTIREEDGGDDFQMEREADRFAAELLMPADLCRQRATEFRKDYRCCPMSAFGYHLASDLLVSPEAMRYHLKRLGVCDEP
jgi:hypothetical protein